MLKLPSDTLPEPLTGALAFDGKRHPEGYDIVPEMINERGGVIGKKIWQPYLGL